MNQVELDDYRWLVGAEAAAWLDEVAVSTESLVRLASMLRRSLTASRSHLILEQVALRRRAREKFGQASRMFFTDKGLQQATDQWIGRYKAARFPRGVAVADLCCGIGGDLMALAQRGAAIGVERDPVICVLAAANCRTFSNDGGSINDGGSNEGGSNEGGRCGMTPVVAEVVCQSAEETDLADFAAWHVDPDRRAAGRRVSHPSAYQPSPTLLQSRMERAPHASIKLAPATTAPESWRGVAEREWIETRGECRQQVAWFGDLARYPGRRVATIIRAGSDKPRTVVERKVRMELAAGGVGRYLFEPAAAVLAAGVVDSLVADYGLEVLAPNVAYLTGDRPLDDAALDAFEVLEQWPFDIKKIRVALRQRNIGSLEIKKRGVSLDPASVRRGLQLRGEHAATLLIAPLAGRTVAFLARRHRGEGTGDRTTGPAES